VPPASSLVPVFQGPRVPEGTYTFRIIKGPNTYEGQVALVSDPRSPHSAEERRLQQRTALDLYGMLERLTYVIDAVIDLRDQARSRAESGGGGTASRLTEYADRLDEFRRSLVSTSEGGIFSSEEKLREHLGALYGAVNGYAGRPTDSELQRMESLGLQLAEAEAAFAELTKAETLESLNSRLLRDEQEPLVLMTREAWEAERSGS
jgi:hypothetical protein